MTMLAELAEPIAQQETWRPDEMRGFKVGLIRAALKLLDEGIVCFGADDVSDEFRGDGAGIAGSVIASLRAAHVIEDWWGDDPERGIRHGRRKSKRPEAHARKVNLFTLCSRGAGEEFLRRAGRPVMAQQQELFA